MIFASILIILIIIISVMFYRLARGDGSGSIVMKIDILKLVHIDFRSTPERIELPSKDITEVADERLPAEDAGTVEMFEEAADSTD